MHNFVFRLINEEQFSFISHRFCYEGDFGEQKNSTRNAMTLRINMHLAHDAHALERRVVMIKININPACNSCFYANRKTSEPEERGQSRGEPSSKKEDLLDSRAKTQEMTSEDIAQDIPNKYNSCYSAKHTSDRIGDQDMTKIPNTYNSCQYANGRTSDRIGRGINPSSKQGYLLDSGATTHVMTSDDDARDIRLTTGYVLVGNGEKCVSTRMARYVLEEQETKNQIVLKDTVIIPGFEKNIISMLRLHDEGYQFDINKDRCLITKQDDEQVRIELKPGPKGAYYLHGKTLGEQGGRSTNESAFPLDEETWHDVEQPIDDQGENVRRTTHKMPKSMDINKLHDTLGHKGEGLLRKTCKHLGIKVTGELKACEACGIAKAKQKAVSKTASIKAQKPGERLFFDTAGPFQPTINKSLYIFCITDDYSRFSWVYFGKMKSQIGKYVKDLVIHLSASDKAVKYLRCDPAGENQSVENFCNARAITLEKTATNTPQQNGVVERRLTVMIQRAHAQMRAANFDDEARNLLWAEAVNNANDMENISSNTLNKKSPYELFTGEKSRLYSKLVEFGRIGQVPLRKKVSGKWKEKSYRAIMVGYAKNRSADTYRLYNPVTRHIVENRDVTWLDWNRLNPARNLSIFKIEPDLLTEMGIDDEEMPVTDDDRAINIIPMGDDDSVAGRMEPRAIFRDEQNAPAIIQDTQDTQERVREEAIIQDTQDTQERVREEEDEEQADADKKAQKLENELRKLDTYYNPTARSTMDKQNVVEDDEETVKVIYFVHHNELSSDFGEPKTFKEAWNGSEREKWKPSMGSEVMNFLNRKAWTKITREKAEKSGKKILKVKWVFKKKDEQDGSIRYKSRIVTKGYLQIPGVDYTESFAPVATDTTIRLLLAIALYRQQEDWIVECLDIEAAFLEGDIDKPIYIEYPEGMDELGFVTRNEMYTHCVELRKSMYGNVDAALRFFRTLKEHLTKNIGMMNSKSDPCVFYLKDDKGETILIVATHVDDCIMAGSKDVIEQFKKDVKKRFNISDLGKIKKHLGIWYEWRQENNGEKYIIATMPKLVKEIIESFESHVEREAKRSKVPGTPGTTLPKAKEEEEAINPEKYRSIVGKIMYLVTKLMVEGCNAARELSKHFQKPVEEHWKELERFVGYLKVNETNIKIIYRRPRELRPMAMVDSNYATNTDDRRSVTGAIFTVGGTITNWISKTQGSVTLSSSEAEYVAIATAAQEVRFTQQLLEEIMSCVLPAIIYEDNTGAIFLVKNQQVGQRTKHISIRAHFIRDLWNQGHLDVQFVRSEDNESDICTKNVTEKILAIFSPHIRNGTLRCWRDWSRLTNEIVRAIWREDVAILDKVDGRQRDNRSRWSNQSENTIRKGARLEMYTFGNRCTFGTEGRK
jgi:hypothetical protein